MVLLIPRTVAIKAEQQIEIIEIKQKQKTIKEIIQEAATQYGVNGDLMLAIVGCESMFNPTIQSNVITNGIREDSWGLSQIHLPSHPEITKEQAIDPYFSANFMAEQISLGRPWKWKGSKNCWSNELSRK